MDTAMSDSSTGQPRPRNRILAALPNDEFGRVAAHLELVTLHVRDLIHDIDQSITHVYFPNSGVTSVVSVLLDGSAVETATIGFEGMVGLAVFHRTDRMAAQAFCQVGGEALRMPVESFRAEIDRAPALTSLLHRYTLALFTQVAQASACNRIHRIHQRCARWLLQTHDRVDADEFALTQDFLAQMLGVRRASVSEVAAAMQRAGLIEYRYGRISIANRAALEESACECYRIITSEYDRLLDGRASPSPLDGVVASDGKTSLLGPPNVEVRELA
jgi:CRP-like cAMP-binding protein